MSLSARIALLPSRGIAHVERAMALGGVAVAAAATLARWPSATGVVAAVGVAFATAVVAAVTARRGGAGAAVIVVADHEAVRLETTRADLPTDGWRLDESTVSWPSFAVVALRDEHGRVLRRPVDMAALPPRDRWALARFLQWSLRAPRAADERRVA